MASYTTSSSYSSETTTVSAPVVTGYTESSSSYVDTTYVTPGATSYVDTTYVTPGATSYVDTAYTVAPMASYVETAYVAPVSTSYVETSYSAPVTSYESTTISYPETITYEMDATVSVPVQEVAYSIGGLYTELSRTMCDPIFLVRDNMSAQRQRLALIDEQIMLANQKLEVLRVHGTAHHASHGDKRLYKHALHDHKKIVAHREKIVRKL